MTTDFGTGLSSSSDSTRAAREAVHQAFDTMDGDAVDFAVVFMSSEHDYESVVEVVRTETDDAELLGASTAGEFTEEGPETGSVAVALVASDDMKLHTSLGTNLSENPERTVKKAVRKFPEDSDEYPYRMGIHLHDGLLGQGEELVLYAYQQYPMDYAGGSAGDDLNLEETVVAVNDTVVSDAVALGMIASKKPFGQAVDHGHEPISEGFQVTKAEGSVVHELDGQPAYEVWKDAVRDIVREDHGYEIDDLTAEDQEFSMALTRFEMGIKTGPEQFKVRWPGLTTTEDGSLTFATKIPEGTKLYVMDSDPEEQIETARSVCSQALNTSRQRDSNPVGALVFDCFCQAAILGDDFHKSIEAMSEELEIPLAGFETYGEVALNADDMRAYHNTTTSMILLPG